ncbi:Exosome complex component rrp4 [Taphrina deformans PYCC 5710]|uniref:Exosome complex component rrp4 n=1 Tax=Taphrina deformans (strain PYCC 5710 / ATCC 11124 / CBS 356.35 / IMI 108563 / JCM 9778 / NBRC 8474) TaxID=1097556 RepID=R4X7N5_TAPDE|nr:Exosome complex component rrp4 [Taphrina deformans PYCC 5710]|eukprot:CCG81446.1 Exosome complex component rrp4 [Taphrina deformans PYCC 5710]
MSVTILRPQRYSPPEYRSSADADEDVDMTDLLPNSEPSLTKITIPGETVTSDAQFMRGHGTYTIDNESGIHASLMGSISRVNKLLSITPLKSRYIPEIGDLVIGVVKEVALKKWRVDINAKTDATLQLASINLPGGIQRRKTGTDELQMRTFFQEGDLLLAEVQSYFQDGSVSLHTRSLKYGKLRDGQFLKVRNGIVARAKQSTVQLGPVDLILGVNGYSFISKHSESLISSNDSGNIHNNTSEAASEAIYSNVNSEISHGIREEISRVRNVLEILSREGVKLDIEVVRKAVEASRVIGEVSDILSAEMGKRIAAEAMYT